MAIPTSEEFAKALVDAGVIPADLSRAHRIVIEAESGKAVEIRVHYFCDSSLAEVAPLLTNAQEGS